MLPASLHRRTARSSVVWGLVLTVAVLAAVGGLVYAAPGIATTIVGIAAVLALLVVVSWIFMAGH